MNVYDSRGRLISIGKSVGRGGEATVYRVNGHPEWLAKIYEPAPRPNYLHKLGWMVDHPPENPTAGFHHDSLAWPAGLLYDSRRRLAGYWMPYVQAAVPILDVFNPRRRAETLPNFNRRYLHRAARNLAASVGALHASGYVVGDLNESNVLVTPSALVTLIDTDSFQVNEQRRDHSSIHYCPVGKPEYSPPELQGKPMEKLLRLPEQDSFGLGVLIFQLLMEGSHPFRAQWLGGGDPPPIEARIAQGGFPYTASPLSPVRPPKNAPDLNRLHPEIAELLRRCFVDGHREPRLRPSPALWERTIAEAEEALIACSRGHIYSSHLRACPACPAPSQHPTGASGPAKKERRTPQTNPPPAPAPRSPGFPFFARRARPSSTRQTPAAGPAAPPNRHGTGASPQRVGTPPKSGWQAPFTGPASAPPNQPAGPKPSPGTSNPKATGGRPVAGSGPAAAGAPAQAQKRPTGFPFSSPWIKTPSANVPGSSPFMRPKSNAQTRAQTNSQPSSASSQTGSSRPARPRPFPWAQSSGSTGFSRSVWVSWQNMFNTRRAQAQPQAGAWDWARPRIFKSLAVGGGIGALAGVLPGALAGVAGWSSGNVAAWGLLWALGGAAGGMLRGYQPGYRFSQWVHRTIGWQYVWPALGLVAGAIGGGFVGLVLGWWAIFPVFVGLYLGARTGVKLGRKIWQAGNQLGWERILAVSGALSAALLGWVAARWFSASGLGSLADQFAGSLAFWLVDHSSSWTLAWAMVGALGGAMGGAVAGILADLFSRFSGLVD